MEWLGVLIVVAVSAVLVLAPYIGLVIGLVTRSELLALRRRVDELERELDARERDRRVEGGRRADGGRRAEPAGSPGAGVREAAPPVGEGGAADGAREGAPAAEAPGREETGAREEVPSPISPEPPPDGSADGARPPAPHISRPSPPARPPHPTRPLPPSRPTSPPRPARPPISTERLLVWVGSAVGGLLVILASLLALAVAVDRGWLGPPARVLGGLASGTLGLHLAVALRRRQHRLVAGALAGAGLGVLYGTVWAASTLYGFFSRPLAMGLMVALVSVALLLADRWRERFVAWLGLLGGLLTPVLLSTGENRAVALFSYLALLLAGAAVAAARRGWPDLLAVGALGGALIHLGWTERYHQPDQVLVGLLAPLLLSLPFAWTASRRSGSSALLGTAAAAALLLPLLGWAWAFPVDPYFDDPRTGVRVLRPDALGPWVALGLSPLLALPSWIVARARRWWGLGLVGSLALALLHLLALAVWSTREALDPRVPALAALVPLGLAAVGLLARGLGRATSPLPASAGLGLGLVVLAIQPAPIPPVLAALPLALLSALGMAGSRRSAWAVAAALGFLLLGLAVGVEVEELGPLRVAAVACLGLALFVPLPALARRFDQPAVPVLLAALAGPAAFFPLHQAWEEGGLGSIIGLLPLLLGALALGTALLLVRARRSHAGDPALALFVAVALLGLSAAIPLQLERQWLTIAWAVEGAALAALSLRLTHPLLRVASVLLGVGVAIRLLVNPWALRYGLAGGMPILNWTLYTWGVPAVCLVLQARWLAQGAGRVPAFVPPLLRVLAALVGFALVHVQVSHAFQDAGPIELGGHGLLQGMVRSVAWAVYGVLVLVVGLRTGHRHVRLVGFALVLVAAGKVFAVDLWQLSGFVRVGSVLGLGLTLLLSAFLFERLVLRQGPQAPPAGPGSSR